MSGRTNSSDDFTLGRTSQSRKRRWFGIVANVKPFKFPSQVTGRFDDDRIIDVSSQRFVIELRGGRHNSTCRSTSQQPCQALPLFGSKRLGLEPQVEVRLGFL